MSQAGGTGTNLNGTSKPPSSKHRHRPKPARSKPPKPSSSSPTNNNVVPALAQPQTKPSEDMFGTSTPVYDRAAEEEEEDVCLICAEPIRFYALGTCSHRTCHICSIRLRALYKQKACTICKTELPHVVFTVSPDAPYSAYDINQIAFRDKVLDIYFETSAMLEETLALLKFNCPWSSYTSLSAATAAAQTTAPEIDDKGKAREHVDIAQIKQGECDILSTGWSDLKRHVKKHNRVLCDLCVANKKMFSHEHTLFTPATLQSHMRYGDAAPGAGDDAEATGFTGHPACDFCRINYYDSDQLYSHCRKEHEQCFICVRNEWGRYQYFRDFKELEGHFATEHFACHAPTCLAQRFVVFETEIDLQAHQVESHGAEMPSDQRSRLGARRLDIDIHYNNAPASSSSRPRPPKRNGPGPKPMVLPGRGHLPGEDEPHLHRVVPGSQRPSRPNFQASLTPANASNHTTAVDPVQERHASLLQKVASAVSGSDGKITAFKTAVRSFRAGEMAAEDLVDTIWHILNRATDVAAEIINDMAELLDNDDKARDVTRAWRNFSIAHDSFPSLTPLAPTRTEGGQQVSWQSGQRARPQKTGQRNAAIWASVDRAATRSDAFPSLPKSRAQPIPGLRKGTTPWSTSSVAAQQTRMTSHQPSPRVSPGPSFPAMSSLSVSTPVSRPLELQAPPSGHVPHASQFPGLPQSTAHARRKIELEKLRKANAMIASPWQTSNSSTRSPSPEFEQLRIDEEPAVRTPVASKQSKKPKKQLLFTNSRI
ncbi:uncharacterized protein L969DRAFT_45026 [Mixia osmundae IAM 14324]|uniref:RING-type domain-containing protein n=1 Tax=Mixia osmundae (strain CBS 9802 / IAM 14324 / JCM 22182 / KY 12970) TaxID=764103 RepID=G7DY66_MIXOS|nr:uncharacterized protein L969DRAFT_45026 [Mixia osmundae IAM 14324]KEI41428.1 hypothetical protein L969DRAFT_45026 [Mixia osmundae IAM 14324]GAA95526.1 hypothetical protein E5Q_02181 [Mixia osmundae IAM 14324]